MHQGHDCACQQKVNRQKLMVKITYPQKLNPSKFSPYAVFYPIYSVIELYTATIERQYATILNNYDIAICVAYKINYTVYLVGLYCHLEYPSMYLMPGSPRAIDHTAQHWRIPAH